MSNMPPPLPPTAPPTVPPTLAPHRPPAMPYGQPAPLAYAVPADGVVCPRCGQYGAKPVGFSWWGGVLGPKLLSHTKCPNCKFTFNRKTGRSNNTAIAIYLGIGTLLGLAVGVLFYFIRM